MISFGMEKDEEDEHKKETTEKMKEMRNTSKMKETSRTPTFSWKS